MAPGCAQLSWDVLCCLPGNSRTEGIGTREHLSPTETQFPPPSHLEQPGEVNKGCSFPCSHRASSLPLLFPERAPEQFPDEATAALSSPNPGPAPSFRLGFVVFQVNTGEKSNFNLSVPLWQPLKVLKPKLTRFRHGEEEGIKKADVAELLFGLGSSVLDQRAAQARAASCPHNGQPQPGRKAWEGGQGQLWNPQSPGEAGATAGSPASPRCPTRSCLWPS